MVVLLLVASVPSVGSQVLEEEKIAAFEAIISAESTGANVTGLVADYNEALQLIETGGLVNVSAGNLILNEIVSEAAVLRVAAVQQGNVDAAVAVVKVVFLVGLAVAVWMRGDLWFWRLWRRTKESYIVE